MSNSLLKDITIMNCALELQSEIIGVKLLSSKEEFDSIPLESTKGQMPYCVMAKLATRGHTIKASYQNIKCPGGAKALGMIELNEEALSGKHYYKLGLYKDEDIAKSYQEDIVFYKKKPYGVLLRPLDQFEDIPDVVIVITNTYNTMRILQGYSYHYGMAKNIRLGGSQALCAEATATPFENNDINISTMCSGTRFWCAWEKGDLAIGMPGNMYSNVVDGILSTLNSTEPIEEKVKIHKKFQENKINFFVDLDKSYYYAYSEHQKKTIPAYKNKISTKSGDCKNQNDRH